MRRRTWLGFGLAGSVLLVLGGGTLGLVRPGWSEGKLTPAGRELFAAVARVVLEGLLPEGGGGGSLDSALLRGHIERLEGAVAGLPSAVQSEIADLTAVLLHPAGRRLLAGLGSEWRTAPITELRAAMQGMRSSSMALRQQAFHALRDLTNGAWFADATSWQAIGYPGPRTI